MDDTKGQLDRIEQKVDKLDIRLDGVDVKLAKYNTELEYHIARTDQIENELLPIVAHVEQLRGATKLITVIAAIVGFLVMIFSFLKG